MFWKSSSPLNSTSSITSSSSLSNNFIHQGCWLHIKIEKCVEGFSRSSPLYNHLVATYWAADVIAPECLLRHCLCAVEGGLHSASHTDVSHAEQPNKNARLLLEACFHRNKYTNFRKIYMLEHAELLWTNYKELLEVSKYKIYFCF